MHADPIPADSLALKLRRAPGIMDRKALDPLLTALALDDGSPRQLSERPTVADHVDLDTHHRECGARLTAKWIDPRNEELTENWCPLCRREVEEREVLVVPHDDQPSRTLAATRTALLRNPARGVNPC